VVTPRPSFPTDASAQRTPRVLPPRTEADLDAAHLLASVASIVSQEINVDQDCMSTQEFLALPHLQTPIRDKKESKKLPFSSGDLIASSPSLSRFCDEEEEEEAKQSGDDNPRQMHLPKFSILQRGMPTASAAANPDELYRIRSVSLDTADAYLPSDIAYLQSNYENVSDENRPSTFVSVPTIISPPTTPSSASTDHSTFPRPKEQPIGPRRLVDRQKKKRSIDALFKDDTETSKKIGGGRNDYVDAAKVLKNHRGIVQPAYTIKPRKNNRLRMIVRKKFSWKNYPELETFLVANRAEYLRHSALNYTTQQKNYNNELTVRLIELASKHGYIFDEKGFNFVIVRDRIRCFYKSFVQSRKKQGVIVGYAARRAGLIDKDELQKIATSKNRIILPAASNKKKKKNSSKTKKARTM